MVQSHGGVVIISLHRVHLTNVLDIGGENFSNVQVMTPPLKGLWTPHILNICSCLINYLSQLQFWSNFTKLFAPVEKYKRRETKKKISR